jgi:hypothetical protein
MPEAMPGKVALEPALLVRAHPQIAREVERVHRQVEMSVNDQHVPAASFA